MLITMLVWKGNDWYMRQKATVERIFSEESYSAGWRWSLGIVATILIGVLLYLLSQLSYLLFHVIVELLSIIIAAAFFLIAWHTRHLTRNSFLVFLGIAYMFVATIDLFHTLAYSGMNIFTWLKGSNAATQLWIGGRLMESTSLLIAPLLLRQRISVGWVWNIYTLFTAALVISVLAGAPLPACFVEGQGLTVCKITLEYLIIAILLGAATVLWIKRSEMAGQTWLMLTGAIVLTICSELAFTLYTDVYGIMNIAGHYLKLGSYLCIYYIMVNRALREPYTLMFRELKDTESALSDANASLSAEVLERRQAQEELERTIGQLMEALTEIKALEGILPICSYCKKIRDDDGNWRELEQYISHHSDAEFSHSICPQCTKKHFPDHSGD